MPPAARITDMHTCPMVTGVVPHVGGPILPPCCPTVLIGMLPAARVGDMLTCVGPPDVIAMGSPTVLIGNMMAARIGDPTVHGGIIILGCPTVIIGDAGGGPSSLSSIANQVNPDKSVINCGNIIDAVIARLDGSNPAATAPPEQDGTFDDIAKRHDTTINWGHNLDDAFKSVKDGGDGTTAIIGIQYKDSDASHVVVMTNQGGKVGIIEGQDWGDGKPAGVITDPAQAKDRYGADSDIGIGVLPKK